MTEAQLCAQIRALCTELHLHAFSATTYLIPGASTTSPGSSRGFPDWVIIGPGGMLFAEAKSADGRRSRAQIFWAAAITGAGGDYRLWRPAGLTDGSIRADLERIARAQ